ncbi:RCC1 domain-containing protein [Brevibacillus laterosporus]|uniref:RCC1 domain-containing protein n=1 Tax=Brevibacillus laterosporus TaxID=1465 RepID=UPI0003B18E6E|nr:copper amine oxidase [Brevibacillus laterosporus]ERM18314.1 copper amine oxidase [Brevibacillus laterosporus PE36]
MQKKFSALILSSVLFASLFSPVASHAQDSFNYDHLLSADNNRTFMVKKDGSVIYGTGSDANGGLGSSSVKGKTTSPVPVDDLSDVLMVDTGTSHTVALQKDGTVWTWGWSAYGELGNEKAKSTEKTPHHVKWLSDVKQVRAGENFTLALREDGTVWAFGKNRSGQLGDGTTETRVKPVQVSGLTDIVAIDAGEEFSLALSEDGTVWAWGNNSVGQLGNGTREKALQPVQVSELTDVIAISTGEKQGFAVTSNGDVYGWGYNQGKLGDGTNKSRNSPVLIDGIYDVIAVDSGKQHTLALKEDGTVWAWGTNTHGQLGYGTPVNYSMTPNQVFLESTEPLNQIVAIDAGGFHSHAIKKDGTVWSWGFNSNGELGLGHSKKQMYPAKIQAINLFD